MASTGGVKGANGLPRKRRILSESERRRRMERERLFGPGFDLRTATAAQKRQARRLNDGFGDGGSPAERRKRRRDARIRGALSGDTRPSLYGEGGYYTATSSTGPAAPSGTPSPSAQQLADARAAARGGRRRRRRKGRRSGTQAQASQPSPYVFGTK